MRAVDASIDRETKSFQITPEVVEERVGSRRPSGSEFQTVGPATEKVRRPNIERAGDAVRAGGRQRTLPMGSWAVLDRRCR